MLPAIKMFQAQVYNFLSQSEKQKYLFYKQIYIFLLLQIYKNIFSYYS